MRSVAFTLPFVLPSLNTMLRTHWSKRQKHQEWLSQEVMVGLGGPRHFPRPPFSVARVTVVRGSAGALDTDGCYASVKPLLDVLCVNSRTHPVGLGIIEDDTPARCHLVVSQQHAARKEQFTAVRVEELA